MFNDPELKEIYYQRIETVERRYEEKIASIRLAKKKYLEHFQKRYQQRD